MTTATGSRTGLDVLRDADVDIDSFTPALRAALTTLSEEEAAVLLEIRRKFDEGGVSELQDSNGNSVF